MSELTPEQRRQIESHIFAGRKIQAIKELRGLTGCDLAGAKQVVEARESELRQSSPEKFTAPQKSGCMMGVVLLLAVAVVLMWL